MMVEEASARPGELVHANGVRRFRPRLSSHPRAPFFPLLSYLHSIHHHLTKDVHPFSLREPGHQENDCSHPVCSQLATAAASLILCNVADRRRMECHWEMYPKPVNARAAYNYKMHSRLYNKSLAKLYRRHVARRQKSLMP